MTGKLPSFFQTRFHRSQVHRYAKIIVKKFVEYIRKLYLEFCEKNGKIVEFCHCRKLGTLLATHHIPGH